jgi:hypothetical protein
MLKRATTLLLLLAAFGGELAAQTIDICEYFVLGRFSKWRFEEVEDPKDVRNIVLTNFKVLKDEVRYTTRLPDVGSLQAMLVTWSKNSAGELVMHNVRFQDEELDPIGGITPPLIFDPPIKIGDGATSLAVDPVVFPVNSSFVIKVKFGPVSESATVFATGTITIDVTGGFDVPTLLDPPDDLIDSSETAVLTITNNVTLSVPEFDEEAIIDDVIVLHLAKNRGVVYMEEELLVENFDARQLVKAILPGRTLGPFAPNPDITTFSFDVPDGVLTLQDNVDAAFTGGAAVNKDGDPTGTLMLTDVDLEHRLGGRLIMTGNASFVGPDPGDVTEVPFTLKGKAAFNAKKEITKLRLAGKTNVGKNKLDILTKPIVIKTKADITPGSDTLQFTFKSGKDAKGTVDLGISPQASPTADVVLDGLVDRKLLPPKARPLGSEGTLTYGGVDYPVTLFETRRTPKQKEGKDPKPDKRSYQLKPTGFINNVASIKASSGEDDVFEDAFIEVTKFAAKIFGGRIKLKEDPDGDLDYTSDYDK